MKIGRVLAPFVVTLVACASSNGTSQDTGLSGPGEGAVVAPDKNPDGVPYPTQSIGTKARSGATAGNRIQNYKFMGYPNGDRAQGLQPIALANYFDPTGEKVRLIHIQASGSWCTYCRQEMDVVNPLKDELAKRKVVWIVTIAEGEAQGTPSKVSDLDKWLAEFKSPYTHVLDSGNKNLGPFYNAAALPWNGTVDAKTMEILSADVGAIIPASNLLAELDEMQKLADASTIK